MIVSDADHALACAVQSVFGGAAQAPEHRLCEWHLSRKLRQHLPDEILQDHGHPITRALPNAFHTPQAWCDPMDAIQAENDSDDDYSLTLTLRWLETYGARVEAQIATRGPEGSYSTGAVEVVLHELDRRLHYRAGSFTNRARMNKLLALMTLELTGRADPRAWTERIRERLYLTADYGQKLY